MSRSTSAAQADTPTAADSRLSSGYFQRSELPLTSLAFVAPLVLFYELGTWFLTFDQSHHGQTRIIAFNLMQQFFQLFGATGRYLPAAAVIGVLLGWHVTRGDSWQVDIRHVLGMLVESLLLAMPLVALGFVAARYLPLLTFTRPPASLLVLSIGAGIYEELVFRLFAFSLLSFVLIDILEIRRTWAYILMVVISSLMFAAYHYLGTETFNWRSFAFRTVAGMYFGMVFAFRGFGITSGCHMFYDIIVVVLRGFA